MSPRRVFDAFLLCDELDLLEARLIELDSAVYRHVLVEAPVTFQGRPKPLYYAENKERFAPWADKIIHVVADLDSYEEHWARERASRETLWRGLDDYGPGDILLHGDIDEIPRAGSCQDAVGRVIAMRHHVLAVNLLDPGWWGGTVGIAGPARPAMHAVRSRRHATSRSGVVHDGGWHFSWLGGGDAMRVKAHSFSHPEMAPAIGDDADEMYRYRRNPREGVHTLLLVSIDSSWPEYMQERRGPACWYWPGSGSSHADVQ